MKKILLLSMPMGALGRPALGLSLLKERLRESNFKCEVRYLTFTFAEFIGHDEYEWLCYQMPYTAFAGDWSFTQALYGERPELENAYVQNVLRDTWRVPQSDIQRIFGIRSRVPYFLDHCMSAIPWSDYAMVGFTSTFEQNIASLALAKRIKKAFPRISIVFGGANWEGEMGLELHRQFPFIDYVCSGESEQSLPALAQRVLKRSKATDELAAIPGLVYRNREGESVSTGSSQMIRDLDTLPLPDFSDYFQDLNQCTVGAPVAPTLLFETSRGCWWGAKSHCTFCGLNGGTMAFRSKSPKRALDELELLVDRWQVTNVEVVDNILDMKYFTDMLPALARARRPLQLFYEVKSNLSRAQVKTLQEAGVYRIQPGIESLSDHVLKLMRKGTTALRNIQLLKWAQEYNVMVEWNLLYGFPGETAEDYRTMLELLPQIRFLRPPGATGPIRLDRFSPYHNTPAEFGLNNVRPLATYHYLYPFDNESLARIAYYFDFDYDPTNDPTGYAEEVVAYIHDWRANPQSGEVRSVSSPNESRNGFNNGSLTIMDTRPNAISREVVLTGLEKEAYEFCDELQSAATVANHLHRVFPEAELTAQSVSEFLNSLVANGLMLTDGSSYLSLALRTPTVQPETELNQSFSIPDFPARPASSYLRAELKVLHA